MPRLLLTMGMLSLITVVGAQRSSAETISHGPWELVLDAAASDWKSLRWNGAVVAESAPAKMSVDVQVAPGQWLGDRRSGEAPRVRHAWEAASATFVLTRNCGAWELAEELRFGAAGNPDRLSRTLRLTYRPAGAKAEPAKFHNVRFRARLPKSGRYLCPANDPFGSGGLGDLAQQRAGFRTSSGRGLGALLVEQDARTLLWINDARRDRASTSLAVVDDQHSDVAQDFQAAGWAEPGVTQTIGPAYLEVATGGLEATLRAAIWRWCDDIGFRVPSDGPAWVRQAALYSFHPGGTIGSGCADLGGFASAQQELLPRLQQLGVGAVWLLPLEDRSLYWPRDYYRLQDGLGGEAAYREFVVAAHGLGLKVWQDLVPHGGSPAFGATRGDRPWWLVFDERGDALDYWCFDFGEPQWQQQMARVAAHYMQGFGIDGFRIDAVGGSHAMNWRRAGFPVAERTPANVPKAWWQESLAAAGGQVPPLPYERGSLTLREGGLQMLQAIRREVKQAQPQAGAVLGEVQGAPYMQAADVVYDFELAHQYLRQIRQYSPAVFARGLQRFLEQQKCSEPRGTVRLRYVESHDTVRARGWYGTRAMQALIALTVWIDGMPMIYHDADLGQGPLLSRVLAVRAALPELQTGEADYEALADQTPGVFTCLRTKAGKSSLVLINLNHTPCELAVPWPAARAPWDATQSYVAWNAMSGQRVGEFAAGAAPVLRLTLAGWEPAVVSLRPAADAAPLAPRTEPAVPQVPPAAAPQVDQRDDVVAVRTGSYRLTVTRATGLLRGLEDAAGKPLLGPAELVLDGSGPTGPAAVQKCTVQSAHADDSVLVQAQLAFAGTGGVELTYRCLPDCVELDARLDPATAAQRAGLVLRASDTWRYQLQTAEGLWDDWFAVRSLSGRPGVSSIYYRPQGTAWLWQSDFAPLHPRDAVLRSIREDGAGVDLRVLRPLDDGPAGAGVLDRFGDQSGWHAVFWWRDQDAHEQPPPTKDHFTVRLSPQSQATPTAAEPAQARVALDHTSLDWLVENPHYRVLLRRTGGVIHSLWAKQPDLRLIAEQNDVYTDRGFRTEQAARASAGDDVETATHVWREGRELHLRFHGLLRHEDRFGIVRPPIWFSTEYAFDDSPTFRLRWGLSSEGPVREETAFVAWMARLPDLRRFSFARAGQELASGRADVAARTGQTSQLPGQPLPEAADLSDARGPLLRVRDLAVRGPAPLQNVFVHGQNFFLAWLDGPAAAWAPGQWHECRLALTVGAAAPVAAVPLPWMTAQPPPPAGLADPSFEADGTELLAVSTGRAVSLGLPLAAAWNMPEGGSFTADTAHHGRRSARIVNTSGAYTLFTQTVRQEKTLLGRRVRLTAWVKGERIERGDAPWKVGAVDLSFRLPDGAMQHRSICELTGTFDWRQVSGTYNVPADASGLHVRLGLNGATGTMWIDQVELAAVEE